MRQTVELVAIGSADGRDPDLRLELRSTVAVLGGAQGYHRRMMIPVPKGIPGRVLSSSGRSPGPAKKRRPDVLRFRG